MYTQPIPPQRSSGRARSARRGNFALARGGVSFARWAALAALASSAACASLSLNEPAYRVIGYAPFPQAPDFAPVASSFATAAPVRRAAPAKPRANAPFSAPNLVIRDSLLAATVQRLRSGSPSFDSAIVAIEQAGVPVVIGTSSQLKDQLPPGYGSVTGWQALTAIYPLTPANAPGRPIDHFSVIIRLSDLRAALTASHSAADTALFDRYIERVVAHEIYGHLIPQLRFGKTTPIVCDDPESAADWYSACVMQRERHVMTQLVESRGTYAILGTR